MKKKHYLLSPFRISFVFFISASILGLAWVEDFTISWKAFDWSTIHYQDSLFVAIQKSFIYSL